jgi:hypothetical protein
MYVLHMYDPNKNILYYTKRLLIYLLFSVFGINLKNWQYQLFIDKYKYLEHIGTCFKICFLVLKLENYFYFSKTIFWL